MATVQVWNDNIYDFEQKMNGKHYRIPAGKYVPMEDDEARLFLGLFYQPLHDADGQQLVQSYKKLRIVKTKEEDAERLYEAFKCNACGEKLEDERALLLHVNDRHLASLYNEDARKEVQSEVSRAKSKKSVKKPVVE